MITRPGSDGPVLVTGGCGFLGSNIADALASRGTSVIALDNFSRAGSEANAQWLRSRHRGRVAVEFGDVRDDAAVDAMISRCAAVIHLAAQVAVTTSVSAPRLDFCVNALGTLNILEAVRRFRPDAPVIFASTNKVYGKVLDDVALSSSSERYQPLDAARARGIDEHQPLDLHSPYGCSKGTADQYVRDYARVYGLKSAVLRMSCIYGPRQFGNEDQGWIAHFLIKAIRGEEITIFGDGRQVRDALYVSDAVAAWLAALDNIDAISGLIFNLGGGPRNALSLRELLRMIADMRRQSPEVRYDAWRPGDQAWYVTDISAISEKLGWTPRIGLAAGLRRLERWLESSLATRPATRRSRVGAPLEEARA